MMGNYSCTNSLKVKRLTRYTNTISALALLCTSTVFGQTVIEPEPGIVETEIQGWTKKQQSGSKALQFTPKNKKKQSLATVRNFTGTNPFELETIAGIAPVDSTSNQLLNLMQSRQLSANANETTIVVVTPLIPVQRPLELSLRDDGLEVLSYFPKNSYIAKGTAAAIEKVSRRKDIYAVGQLPASLKIAPKLISLKNTASSKSATSGLYGSNDYNIVISCHDNSLKNSILPDLIKMGATVIDDSGFDPTVIISIKDLSLIYSIAALPEVSFIEPEIEFTSNLRTSVGLVNHTQLQTDSFHKWGGNISVGMIDTGFVPYHEGFFGTVNALGWNVSGDNGTPYVDYSGHGTHVAGIMGQKTLFDSYTGVNPWMGRSNANPFLFVRCTNNKNLRSLYNTNKALNILRADNRALVTNNSWGSDGDNFGTDYMSILVDQIIWNTGLIHVFSAGNDGPESVTIGSPGGAKNVITVGSLLNAPELTLSEFSSRGPTFDGRAKPEIYAPGQNIAAADASKLTDIVRMSGTSMAAPHVTAVLASLIGQNNHLQARQPHVAKALLMAGAKRLEHLPSYTGVVNSYDTHLNTSTSQIMTGSRTNAEMFKSTTWDIEIPNSCLEAKFVIAWTEPPAQSGTIRAVINDIDLVITAPDGSVHKSQNSVNNFEYISIPNPVPGIYTVSTESYIVRTQYNLGLAVKLETQDVCIYTASPRSGSHLSSATTGSFTLNVNKPGYCDWNAVSNSDWITLTGSHTGNNTKAITYRLTANSSPSSRSGTITAAGKTYTVNQAGYLDGCNINLNATTTTVASEAGYSQFNIITSNSPQCPWEIKSNVEWIQISRIPHGVGSSAVTYSYARNVLPQPRIGVISVGDKTLTVTQLPKKNGTDPEPNVNGPDLGINKARIKANPKKSTAQVQCKIENHSDAVVSGAKLQIVCDNGNGGYDLLGETYLKTLKASTKKPTSVNQKIKFSYSSENTGKDVYAIVVVADGDSNPGNNKIHLGQL